MFCAACGKELRAGSRFCTYCGVGIGEQNHVPQIQEGQGQPQQVGSSIVASGLAGVGRRTLGGLIDFLVLLAVFILLAVFVGDYEVSGGEAHVYLGWAPSLVMLALFFVYFVVMEAVTGRTLGKWILKMKVVNGRGETASWGQSIGRNALRIVDGLPFLYLVGFVAVAASKDKQRLGDMACRTYVVRG